MNMSKLRLSFAALAFAVSSLAATGARADYVLTELTMAGATQMALWDVNNNGVMVGYSAPGTGATDYTSGFIYDGTSFTTLTGPAGSIQNSALGISDSGTVVGNYYAAVDGPSLGFIYAGGVYTTFDVSNLGANTVAGATNTFLRGISSDGRYITGYFTTATSAGVGFVYDGLLGSLIDLSQLNSLQTIAQGVNNAGVVVGSDVLSGPTTTRPGFIYDIATATRTDQFIAGATRTSFRSIDEAGILAGFFADASGTHSFIGSATNFEQLDFAGAATTFAEGSNDAGIVVGTFNYVLNDGVSHAFIATKVPEPGTLGLLGLGLAGLGLTRRRKYA